jgi:hypothetical protein
MGLVYQSEGGLVVAREAADESSVRRALKDRDPRLRLVPQHSDHFGCTVYKVFYDLGSDRPAEFFFGWWNDEMTEAYPLSHALVDMVDRLDKNSRAPKYDPDAEEARIKAERYADYHRDMDELVRDVDARLSGKKSFEQKPGLSLQLSRRRERAKLRDRGFRV